MAYEDHWPRLSPFGPVRGETITVNGVEFRHGDVFRVMNPEIRAKNGPWRLEMGDLAHPNRLYVVVYSEQHQCTRAVELADGALNALAVSGGPWDIVELWPLESVA